MRSRFTVSVSREGKWWIGEIIGIKGAATEVTRLIDLEIEVRDLISGLLDIDDDDIDLDWDMSEILGSAGQATWKTYQTERDELARLKAVVEGERLATLKTLKDAGVSARDSATLVGLSHQRVAQLLAG
ncbi:MAG: hypothetical protein FWG25_06850 [Promicromonosporaceae bacterium]|nr:hypothetical protein [Promicromonosporaceae bacterium]